MYTALTTLSPFVASAYSLGVKLWLSGWPSLTQASLNLERSQRCWWVSTMGVIGGSSLAAAARAAEAAAAAERNSRRFNPVPSGRCAGLYSRRAGGERRRGGSSYRSQRTYGSYRSDGTSPPSLADAFEGRLGRERSPRPLGPAGELGQHAPRVGRVDPLQEPDA